MPEPRYPFVHVDVPEELADALSLALFDLGAEGVEVRDAGTLARSAQAGEVTLVAAFSSREGAERAVAALDEELRPRIEELVGDAWRDAWKEHYKPFSLTPRVTVRPPWERCEPTRDDEIVLELEPGRAFGTGLHATTSLVARALDHGSSRLAGARVLDVGTGSGILSLVALSLGAAAAVAVDDDEDVLGVVRENAARNGLEGRLEASATPVGALTERFPVVVANIEARVLIPLAAEISARVAAGGLLLLSGILDGQEADVAAAYAPMRELERTREGEWVCLALTTSP
ncbi:MAG: 50S ribosomal protein L11 methyltransferase [Polyangiaceae bacterium]|nr:50S ribosomal protein L11 methyltransferase [Polyangiaceae bacterium]